MSHLISRSSNDPCHRGLAAGASAQTGCCPQGPEANQAPSQGTCEAVPRACRTRPGTREPTRGALKERSSLKKGSLRENTPSWPAGCFRVTEDLPRFYVCERLARRLWIRSIQRNVPDVSLYRQSCRIPLYPITKVSHPGRSRASIRDLRNRSCRNLQDRASDRCDRVAPARELAAPALIEAEATHEL
jgi:hypothetical protein